MEGHEGEDEESDNEDGQDEKSKTWLIITEVLTYNMSQKLIFASHIWVCSRGFKLCDVCDIF